MAMKKFPRRRTKAEGKRVTQITRWIGEGVDFCSEDHERAEENQTYVRGEQWAKGDIQRQAMKDRPSIPLNKVLTVVNAVANREIMSRYQPKVFGRSKDDHGWAEVANKFLTWQRDRAETEHEASMAFRDMVISGYGVIHKHFDHMEAAGAGHVMDERVPVWEMLWPADATKQNLVDRRWHIRGRWVNRDEAEEEWGDLNARTRKFFRELDATEYAGSKANYGPGGAWSEVKRGNWYHHAERQVFIVEAEWRDVEVVYRAAVPVALEELGRLVADPEHVVAIPGEGIDPNTGEPMFVQISGAEYQEMPEEAQRSVRDFLLYETEVEEFRVLRELEDFGDRYFDITGEEFEDFAKTKRYVYKYAFMLDDMILEQGERPMGFTYEFLTGFPHHSREQTKFFGVVDVAKGPQDWRNTLFNLVLTRLQTSPKQTLIFEEGAIEDTDTFFNDLANPRGAVGVPDGFIAENRFTLLPMAQFPPLERELLQIAESAVNEIAGLSGLDVGAQQDLRRISGRVVQSVREASTTVLAILFDALRRYRRRDGMLTLRFMEEFYEPRELLRLVGDEYGEMILPESRWPESWRLDVRIEEESSSADEKMDMLDFLTRTGILEGWVSAGHLPMDVVVDWMPFSEADKLRIRQHREETQADQSMLDQLVQFMQQIPGGPDILQAFEQQAAGGPAGPAE